jgi:hypothetical protein
MTVRKMKRMMRMRRRKMMRVRKRRNRLRSSEPRPFRYNTLLTLT